MNRTTYGSILIFALAVFLLPFFISNPYYLSILIFIGIYSIATMGLNLLMGYAGQISLGHGAFFGIGAYTSGILTVHYHVPISAAFVLALLLTGTVAYLIGVPSLRLRGHYLAMATLAFAEIVNIFLDAATDLTGGPSGFGEIPRIQLGSFILDTEVSYFYFVWALFIVFFILANNIINSRVGRALRSIHGSELAATAMGVNAARLKIQVFILSALIASISGSLYAHYVTFISPTTCNIMFSILLVTMVVVGGMANIWGSVLGAALLTVLPEYLRVFEDYDVIVYGFILLFIIMFLPGGLTQGFAMAYKKVRGAGGRAAEK
ncbi:MAG: branched-chain amino acid ABC transporter permease [Proteobacteria bacterium]|nr:branched-chain amino acid ABC transporter permease [Pseudomonadota bacterium]